MVARNGCAASSTTDEAAPHVRPPSPEALTRTADVPAALSSNHVAYTRPPPAAADTASPNERMVPPRSGSPVCVAVKDATVAGADQVAPPSADRVAAIRAGRPGASGLPSANSTSRAPAAGASSASNCAPEPAS